MDITEALEQFVPMYALVVYKCKSENYIEITDIEDGVSGASRPLPLETAKSIFSNLVAAESGMVRAKGLLPRNVLYFDANVGDFIVVWYRKSEIRTLKFEKSLKMPDYTIKVPAMIYKATRTGMSVWAIKDTKVPRERTELFHAPYPNVYPDGKVCLGTAKKNIPTIITVQEIMAEYEKLFWYSEFTNNNNYIKKWKTITKGNWIHYPIDVLDSTKLILKDIIR
jgi:PRTRC genetic system protein B